jgi:Na+/H+-dicarboxylate symporter/ABC-type amino acid transport substrate-binding protein
MGRQPLTIDEQARARSREPRTLSARIGIGLAAGLALGLFLGDRASIFQFIAAGYINLLQMTVLPYVTVSIIGGLGALRPREARALGKSVGGVLALFWAVALAVVFLFPLMFPSNQSASFFSTTLLEEREPFDFLNLYIPTNPFNALANSVVPAVVLFSIGVGIALMTIPEKARLLDVLAVFRTAVSKVTDFVVSLTPYGVFAIGAVLAGTLNLAELERLEVYLVSYAGMSLFLSVWVLPGLVATLTPVPYRALMRRSQDALVLAFMTTSLFAVLPLLSEHAKSLIRDHVKKDEESAAATDVIVPASFNFPHVGKVLSLSFLFFAGWYADQRIPLVEYPRVAVAGLLAMFGSSSAAIPFLLDLFRIPADTFRLFVTSGVLNARFGTLLAAVHTLAVAVLGTCAIAGTLTVDRRKLVRFAVTTVLLAVAIVGGTRLFVEAAFDRPYDQDKILTGMQMLHEWQETRVFKSGDSVPAPPGVATSVMDRVRTHRVLRVGYFDDSLPYAFFNDRNELVGFDVEMAHHLARDLNVELDLVPIGREVLDSGLDSSECDLVMSGVAITVDRSANVQFSASYLDETVAFIVPDHQKTAFSEWSGIRSMSPLRLGAPNAPYFVRKIRDELSNVDVVVFDRMSDMFAPQNPPLDAFVATAERGSAYTLLHPAYSVVVPSPRPLRVPLAYVIAGRDEALTSMVNTWIEQKRKDGTIDRLFEHWILGQQSAPRERRWSVIDDVLGWTR